MTRLAVIVAILSCSLSAGPATFRASNREAWGHEVGAVSLVLGEVQSISREQEPGAHVMKVRPIASFAGGFDATRHEHLDIRLWFAEPPGRIAVQRLPLEGSTAIAVVKRKGDDSYVVLSDYCDFMPNNVPLVEVEGLADPQVAKIIERVRSARTE